MQPTDPTGLPCRVAEGEQRVGTQAKDGLFTSDQWSKIRGACSKHDSPFPSSSTAGAVFVVGGVAARPLKQCYG